MDTDRNLLFGVLALQADLLDVEQFARACTLWSAQKDTPLAELLVQQGWLTPNDRADIEKLLDRKLKKHQGDCGASLTEVITDSVRQVLSTVCDADVRQSLARLTPSAPSYVVPSTSPPIPEFRERYRLSRLHATGGLGRVWLAHDSSLGRDVALKELRPDRAAGPAMSARFLKEAQITGQLEHPGIVPIYDLGRGPQDRSPFYTMRFVRGRTLAEAVASYHRRSREGQVGPLELRELLGAFVGVCNAVAYAHARGVLHRDLKPQNVVLGDYGEVIVLDWGLARLLSPAAGCGEPAAAPVTAEAEVKATVQGEVLGTPAFMAPEQAEGRLDQLGPATDVYGLGAILYELLTGQPPFTAPETTAVLRQVIHELPARPRAIVAETDRALEAVCLKALAKRSVDRYASAKELADEIQRWLADEPVSAYCEPWMVRSGRWVRHHRATMLATVAAVTMAAVCLAVATLLLSAARQRERQAKFLAEQNEQQAEQQRDRARDRFVLARTAVDKYYTRVSESQELKAHGLETLRTNLLETAAEFYEKFTQEEEAGPDVQAERARAYNRLGRLYEAIGRHQEADAAFQRSLALWQQLGEEQPAEPGAQAAVAGTYHRLGWLYQNIGRRTEAEEAHTKSASMWEQLIKQYPGEPDYQDSLAWTFNDLGILYSHTAGPPARVKEAYGKALAIRARLVGEYPENDTYRDSLAASHTNLGKFYLFNGPQELAEKEYQQSLELQKQLRLKHPNVPSHQSKLASAYYNMGFFYDRARQARKAESAYQEALRLQEPLAAEHPTVLDYQKELAHTQNMLAVLYRNNMNRLAEAGELYQKAIAIHEKLFHDYPTVPDIAVELGGNHCNQGDLLVTLHDYPGATEAFHRATQLLEAVLRKDDHNTTARRYLLIVHQKLGFMYRERGLRKEAEVAYRNIVETSERLARDNPASPEETAMLGGSYCNLGNRQFENKKPEAALSSYTRAIQTLEGLLQKDPKNVRVRLFLANSFVGRGSTQSKLLQRHADALQDLDRALSFAPEADRDGARTGRACALARSGDHPRAIAEAQELSTKKSATSENLLHCGRTYALAAAAVLKDARLAGAERDRLAEQYAARAVALLNQIAVKGFFKTRTAVEDLKSDPDFAAVQPRQEFKKLLTDLEKGIKAGN
jgi:serine/threonine-protein kinase